MIGRVARCKGCGRVRTMRPRGLCCRCYRTRREEFPKVAWAGKVWEGREGGGEPSEATAFGPGSAGKIAVMAGRADRGEGLFHADDAGETDWAGVLSVLSRFGEGA